MQDMRDGTTTTKKNNVTFKNITTGEGSSKTLNKV